MIALVDIDVITTGGNADPDVKKLIRFMRKSGYRVYVMIPSSADLDARCAWITWFAKQYIEVDEIVAEPVHSDLRIT